MINAYVSLQTEFEDSLELLCGFVRRQLRRATMEKFEVEREASHPPVPVPYLFLTPKVRQFTIMSAILIMVMSPVSSQLHSTKNFFDDSAVGLLFCMAWSNPLDFMSVTFPLPSILVSLVMYLTTFSSIFFITHYEYSVGRVAQSV